MRDNSLHSIIFKHKLHIEELNAVELLYHEDIENQQLGITLLYHTFGWSASAIARFSNICVDVFLGKWFIADGWGIAIDSNWNQELPDEPEGWTTSIKLTLNNKVSWFHFHNQKSIIDCYSIIDSWIAILIRRYHGKRTVFRKPNHKRKYAWEY